MGTQPLELQTIEELEAELGFRLRKIRLNKNLKQSAVAAKAGISEKAFRNLEKGKGSSIETFVRVLKALDNVRAIEFLAPTVTVNPIALLMRKNKATAKQRAVTSRRSIEKRKREAMAEVDAWLES